MLIRGNDEFSHVCNFANSLLIPTLCQFIQAIKIITAKRFTTMHDIRLSKHRHSISAHPHPHSLPLFPPSSLLKIPNPSLQTLPTMSSPILQTSPPLNVKLTSETSLECPPLKTTAPPFFFQFSGFDDVSRTTASEDPDANKSFFIASFIQNVSQRKRGWENIWRGPRFKWPISYV